MSKPRSIEDIMGQVWRLIPDPMEDARDLDKALGYISGVLDGMRLQGAVCPEQKDWDSQVGDVLDAISPVLDARKREYLAQALKLVLGGENPTPSGEFRIYKKVAFICESRPNEVQATVTAAAFQMLADMPKWTAQKIFGESYEKDRFPPMWVFLMLLFPNSSFRFSKRLQRLRQRSKTNLSPCCRNPLISSFPFLSAVCSWR